MCFIVSKQPTHARPHRHKKKKEIELDALHSNIEYGPGSSSLE